MSRKTYMDTQEFTPQKKSPDSRTGGIVSVTVIEGEEVDFARTVSFRKTGRVRIGRSSENDVVLHDQKVSNIHAELMITETGPDTKEMELRDLDSTNGSYHNDRKITRTLLEHGDKVRLGGTVLLLSLSDRVESAYHSRLFEMAIRDTQTGLYNRRYLLQTLKNTFTVVKRNRRDLGLIIIDIDDFKQINDNFGHVAGDEYLRIVGGVLKNSLREQDVCGRYGGEEFILLLPETGPVGTRRVGEKIRSRVEQLKVPFRNREMRTTISGGIACYHSSVPSSEDLIARADRALYQAKYQGKNRVCG